MAKTKTPKLIGDVPASVLAGALQDLLEKISRGKGWWEKFLMFLKGQNPFAKQGDIAVPEGMEPDQAIEVLEAYQKGAMAAFLEKEQLLQDWERFYSIIFGIKVDFSKLKIPENPEDFRWVVIVPQGLTCNELFNKCKEKFGAWRFYDDLNKEVISIRTTKETYAVRIRDRVEADDENKGLSLILCQKSEDIRIGEGITLEERLVLELFYWWKNNGTHLDLKSWTLCSGSRDRDGHAVIVVWNSYDKLYVYDTASDHDYDNLRTRSVVSLEKLPLAA